MSNVHSVLDLGCGPGTNIALFKAAEYLGIDLNAQYVAFARRRYHREFEAADLRIDIPTYGRRFDFVLLNSLMHHIDHQNCSRILHGVHEVLTPDGHVNIIDLVLPDQPCVARWLAQKDRGDFPRPLSQWKEMFFDVFDPVVFEEFSERIPGVELWNLVYFKGRRRLAK